MDGIIGFRAFLRIWTRLVIDFPRRSLETHRAPKTMRLLKLLPGDFYSAAVNIFYSVGLTNLIRLGDLSQTCHPRKSNKQVVALCQGHDITEFSKRGFSHLPITYIRENVIDTCWYYVEVFCCIHR